MKDNILELMSDWISEYGEDFVDYHCYFGDAEKFCDFLLEKNAVKKEEIDRVKEKYEEINQRLFNGKREKMVIQEVFTEIEKFENDEIFYDLFAEFISRDKELMKSFCEYLVEEEDSKAKPVLIKEILDFCETI